ncbi:GCN5-related N-acetyltransferase [Collimonas arenae]|uniref:GCN5-related N-acetyltransferase n=2 Tax=Collimonas arenae TaxID=279058 RepID=A0A0A1FD26_9BURK|nr:GCN5-related N-acetyltransferase [Collimonas arenae]
MHADQRIEVRHARANDAGKIEALYRQLVPDQDITVSGKRIKQIAGDPRAALLVCDIDGEVNATALVALCSDVMYNMQPFAVVENIVVHDSSRGRGVGEILVKAIERFCESHDCSKIMLLSSTSRSDAHRFFDKMGFRGDSKRGFIKYRRDFAVSC